MFKLGFYTNLYYSIIEKAKQRNSGDETHHILPRSFGGNDAHTNLVKLTYREHFLCHFLLVKMTDGLYRVKMAHAFWRMNNASKRKKDLFPKASKYYEYSKKLMSGNLKGRKLPDNHPWKIGGPKPESHKVSMRGARPHINQKGSNNNNFKGWYVTPWGTFESSTAATKSAPQKIDNATLIDYCIFNNTKSWLTSKSKFVTKGSTPKECGFNFKDKI